jgi:CIC family chloride channel protein
MPTLEFLRRQLAATEALPQLALVAACTGVAVGVIILLFRGIVDYTLGLALDHSGDFESLALAERAALPLMGATLIGVGLTRFAQSDRRVGVVHVMERLSRHQGHLPLRNATVQFVGGVVALITGQSGGREGPAIHLGAASASLIGQRFRLPNNSMRTLVACGTAAAIASSFNTPIAGVIFAMEVVMMEYTIASFIPVIIAAVTSTFLTHWWLGNEPAFHVPEVVGATLLELPLIVVAGLVIGVVAAGFSVALRWFASVERWPFWLRAVIAGSITALAATVCPEIMGVGYDTVNAAMFGEVALGTLIAFVILKSVSNAAAVGLGLPVGLIGPTMAIGAAVGAVFAILAGPLMQDSASPAALWVILGMSAMMAAVLQAPLAALMAVLEMTAAPAMIPAAMLIIVVATLTSSEVFRQKPIYLSILSTLGLQYPPGPVTQFLQRTGVTAIMAREIVRLPRMIGRSAAEDALTSRPRWILVEDDGHLRCILNAADLRAFLEDHPQVDEVHLLRMPGMRKDIADIDSRATIAEARQALGDKRAEALCVRGHSAGPVLGVVTQDAIDRFARTGGHA